MEPILAPTTTKRGSVMKNEKPKVKEPMEPMPAPTARLANDFIYVAYGTNTGTDGFSR